MHMAPILHSGLHPFYWDKVHIPENVYFTMYNSVAFGIFTGLSHCLTPEYFYPRKKARTPLAVTPHPFLPHSLAVINLLAVSTDLPVPDIVT